MNRRGRAEDSCKQGVSKIIYLQIIYKIYMKF